MSWGQYTLEAVPQIDRYRWLKPRHMVNISDRWAWSKTDDLQYAFFNGADGSPGKTAFSNGLWGVGNPRRH
jgi:iron(II)-dependent oxidoreductase